MAISSLEKSAIHTFTNKPWSIDECIENYAKAGIGGITVWRETIEGHDLKRVDKHIQDAGLAPVALARSGFFTGKTKEERDAAIEVNKAAILEAAALRLPMVVLVCGATPGQNVTTNIAQIQEGIEILIPFAEEHNVQLAVEPLHPMYAGNRSAVASLGCANDICEAINHPLVGVALDVFHVWWDNQLEREIKRCGERIFGFHICDYKADFEHPLLDRGLMGEGVIDIPQIRGWVEEAGFTGYNEVEVFSQKWWSHNQHDYLAEIVKAYTEAS